jgi:hypothetical protein
MLSTSLKLIISGASFLVIFIAGFILHNSGKPYNTALFTLHKLVSIAVVIFLVSTVIKIHRVTPLTSLQIITLVITALLFLATVATGGMLSVDKVWPPVVSTIHKILPFLTLLSTSASLYLLLFKIR